MPHVNARVCSLNRGRYIVLFLSVEKLKDNYQVIVIGGGAAGLMAAGQAALSGARTLLLEKMPQPGRKVRITGKGRCNLTNVCELAAFIARFGPNGRFLRQAFGKFFSHDLVAFLGEIGVETITERGGRVFPATELAGDVVDAMLKWVTESGVHLHERSKVTRLPTDENRVVGVELSQGKSDSRQFYADTVIVATGGASYPATGSSGDGYRLAEQVGHHVIEARPALVPLETSDNTAERLQGLALKNVAVRLLVNGRKQYDETGEMMFTHFGLSGPIILTLSRRAVDGLRENHTVVVSIDLKPALDERKLDARLLRDIQTHGRRQFLSLLKGLLPVKLIPVCTDLVGISGDKPANQISAEERKRLRAWLKDFRFTVTGHRPFAEAIITAGGVSTKEIDPRTMASRLVPGLYFAGEVIDIDGDTGGYNLQAAFSTGWLAGNAAAKQALAG